MLEDVCTKLYNVGNPNLECDIAHLDLSVYEADVALSSEVAKMAMSRNMTARQKRIPEGTMKAAADASDRFSQHL